MAEKMMKKIMEEMMVQWLYKIGNSCMYVIYLSNLLVCTCTSNKIIIFKQKCERFRVGTCIGKGMETRL